MIYTILTIKAMKIAYEAHQGQYDKIGVPYIYHPIHIAEQMQDEESCCVALLHDVVEDTEITLDELRKDFPANIIEAVKAMTHENNVPYLDYVAKIKENPIATKVKIEDLKHNMDQQRADAGQMVINERMKKKRELYRQALKMLTE